MSYLTKAETAVANMGYFGLVGPAIAALPSPVSRRIFSHLPKALMPERLRLVSGFALARDHTGLSGIYQAAAGIGGIIYRYTIINSNSPGDGLAFAIGIGSAAIFLDGLARLVRSSIESMADGIPGRPVGIGEGLPALACVIGRRMYEDSFDTPRHLNGTS